MRKALAAVLLLVPAPAPLLSSSYPTPQETRAEFEAVCERMGRDNLYFGSSVLDYLRGRLAAPGLEGEAEVMLRGQLGWELVRLDQVAEGIRELELALELSGPQGRAPDAELHRRLLLNLAIAHLLRGEDQNCLARHTARSCILPIADEAVHALPQEARAAGDLYLRYLELYPGDLHARWLLNLARMISGDFPAGVPEPLRLPSGALASETEFRSWEQIGGRLGISSFFDLAGGAVMEDFDGDGLLDLVSSSSHPCDPMRAFRNDGRGGFEEVSTAWGLKGQLGGLNLVHADYDNDGAADLLVLRGAWWGEDGRMRNSLLRNDLRREAGRFVDVTAVAGLAYPAFPTQAAAWADYDGDGDLDLYVGNEATGTSTDPLKLFGQGGNPYPSQLFRNNGDGTFTDVARAAGLLNRRFTKAVAWGDYDNDGDPDLYVSTFGPNRLYRNERDGTFSEVAEQAGVTEPTHQSFATWFFDFDNDGWLDLFVADYSSPFSEVSASYVGRQREVGHPLVYRNLGGRFEEVSEALGLTRPLLPMGANYGDLDNDGWPDIYLGTGVPDFDAIQPNVMYRNDGGRRFQDVTFAGGFGHLQKGHGIAFGDLDNDGDQDLFEQLGGAFPYDRYSNVLYENPGWEHAWVTLRLEGRRANRLGIGARIEVRVREPGGVSRSVHLLAGSGGSFGGSSLQQEVGLGAAEAIEAIVIHWPGSGTRQVFEGVEPRRTYRAVEGEQELIPVDLPRLRLAAAPEPPHH